MKELLDDMKAHGAVVVRMTQDMQLIRREGARVGIDGSLVVPFEIPEGTPLLVISVDTIIETLAHKLYLAAPTGKETHETL